MNGAPRPTVLIVEDEVKLARLLGEYLERATYASHWIERGDEVEAWVRAHDPALVLLDLMLPGRDGMEVCRDLRRFSQVPIIMVTARVEEIDRLLGLELGADDYVCKPYSPREVVARVKAVLRRPATPLASASGRLQIDGEGYRVVLDRRPVDLTPVEFRMLRALARHPGRVFSRDALMGHLYEDCRVVSGRTIDSHVKNLRHKMQQIAPGEELIRSVYGVGYALEL